MEEGEHYILVQNNLFSLKMDKSLFIFFESLAAASSAASPNKVGMQSLRSYPAGCGGEVD